ncbi:uncharacterized protein BDCG_03209 [Blastomyces dermatitidis ER-3]|uniref:Uncharacterized protein n=3 Tax=Blastomyces TaxID=229219 RepID=A0A179UDL6_BLAGS|nr:uncharacterized protein BDBG_02350 [Blastomyces gilchristii SLH14081]XP_045275302.1 uncharacterized protein BDCG_03209 [Blastomyces dermatitidis ER-3]EEQ88089.2 hypothetical protein BDCG_03209 [Blastomyces dermatitidis ER-3]EGE79511.2 hypothetical protein BDDG_02452 [Blastomyces dermatitidis ATCC 18188]OAT06064.1 hypothetical protein BDBG_02350 [Blastomyces gilchristii SLH14081]
MSAPTRLMSLPALKETPSSVENHELLEFQQRPPVDSLSIERIASPFHTSFGITFTDLASTQQRYGNPQFFGFRLAANGVCVSTSGECSPAATAWFIDKLKLPVIQKTSWNQGSSQRDRSSRRVQGLHSRRPTIQIRRMDHFCFIIFVLIYPAHKVAKSQSRNETPNKYDLDCARSLVWLSPQSAVGNPNPNSSRPE